MRIIESSELFTEIVNGYKHENKHCGTNMLLMQNEINDLIGAGKLYYDLIEGILWFFVKQGDYYIAYFYLPKEEKLKLMPQDLDVIVEIIGNQTRYNSEWEEALLESGFEKHNKNFEYLEKREECQIEVRLIQEKMNKFVEKMGCHHRSAKKEDYEAMYQLWTSKIDNYAVHAMTDKELDEMERYNRAHLILNKKNEILAAVYYLRTGNTANVLYNASLQKGFGAVVRLFMADHAFQEGCDRLISWVYEDNKDLPFNVNPTWIQKNAITKTGKFSQQFLLRKAN